MISSVLDILRRPALFLTVVVFAVLFALPANAQFYFGRNKVQYDNFDWQMMTTEHFHLYFYTEEEEVAQTAAHLAESAYRELAVKFNHEIDKKIPLIIYSAPGHFAQTNVIPQLLPESVGGFTEFLKGRVVVPFNGSYHDFDHVITHELVHVFMLSRLGLQTSRQSRPRWAYPPLWFTEGIAEYWSQGWNTDADMVIADLVLSGNLISIEEFWKVHGTYFMYKLGQSVCKFIEEEYGADKLTRLFDNWTKGRDFDQVVRWTLGDNLKELSRKWEYALKKKYFPRIEHADLPAMESDKLTYDGYCVRGVPIAWDDGSGTGDWVVFMAARMGYSGIYIKPREANDNGLRTLVKGERSSRFESLHMLRSGIDATNSGLVAFSSKSKDKDVIYIYDLNEGKVVADYRMSDLVAVRSPRFSPDEARLVFTGFKSSGYSDLFLLDLETGESRAITSDIFDDFDPAFTSDGKRIIFASDRCAQGATGATCIFEIGLTGGDVTQLTCGDQRDQSPEPTEHGIYFSSDREGTFNLHLLDNYGNIVRKSDFVTGVLDPRLSPDGTRLLFSGYQGMRFQVYQVDVETTSEPVECFTSSDSVSWFPNKIETRYSETSIKYDTDYSLDIAQSMIGYDPIYGSVGGIQVSVSDVLGDHSFYFLLANTASNKEDFLSSFNAGVTYINREKRLNWGVGAFHLYNEYYNDHDQYYDHRQAGLLSLVSYPISKFNRFDLSCFARYSHKDLRYGFEDSEGFLVSNYVSWVFDNSIWDISGPIEGRRYNLSAGVTFSVNEGRNWNRVAFADIRHYFRLGRYSAIANRLFAYSSGGFDPQRMYLGGSWSLRGYDTRAFYNRNILFASNELRFPLIDALLIGFPIGGFGFQAIRGALFFDVGSAWDDDFDQFLGSFGGGFRVGLGYVMLLRFDFARTTDFRTISPSTDFDFFFGWNF